MDCPISPHQDHYIAYHSAFGQIFISPHAQSPVPHLVSSLCHLSRTVAPKTEDTHRPAEAPNPGPQHLPPPPRFHPLPQNLTIHPLNFPLFHRFPPHVSLPPQQPKCLSPKSNPDRQCRPEQIWMAGARRRENIRENERGCGDCGEEELVAGCDGAKMLEGVMRRRSRREEEKRGESCC